MPQAQTTASASSDRRSRTKAGGPLPAFLSPITVPLSRAYGRVIAMRNARYDRGTGVVKFNRPVISIGNITTGGTGKTPMTVWITRQLIEHRCQPVIAMRGYAAKDGEPSDEQAQYRELLPDVEVLANPDRAAALRAFLPARPQVKCILLDDGFQHRQIYRDLDLVLIDARADTFDQRMLPAGHLREPLGNLKRADAVIVTHADSDFSQAEISNLTSQNEKHHGKPPLAWSRHEWAELTTFRNDGEAAREDVSWLRGKRVVTMLGIGRPQSVLDELERCGAKVMANVPAADHEQYDRAKIATARGLCDGGDALIVTAKDWVKLRSLIDLKRWPAAIVVPRLEIDVFDGESALKELILAAAQAPVVPSPRGPD